jgi:membrane glycosyltransferase
MLSAEVTSISSMVGLKRRRHRRRHRRRSSQPQRPPEAMDDWERHFLQKSIRRKEKRERHDRKKKIRRWIVLTITVAVAFAIVTLISRTPSQHQQPARSAVTLS